VGEILLAFRSGAEANAWLTAWFDAQKSVPPDAVRAETDDASRLAAGLPWIGALLSALAIVLIALGQ